jgi:hypothetical protein
MALDITKINNFSYDLFPQNLGLLTTLFISRITFNLNALIIKKTILFIINVIRIFRAVFIWLSLNF